jgi:hypothetical protein
MTKQAPVSFRAARAGGKGGASPTMPFAAPILFGLASDCSGRGAETALRERNNFQQNANGSLDPRRSRPFNPRSSGAPITSIGQKGIRCAAVQRRSKSGAAPATVGGESFSYVPLDLAMQGLGRQRRVTTREPGDLPERRHPSDARRARVGRTSAAVTSTMCHTDGGRP